LALHFPSAEVSHPFPQAIADSLTAGIRDGLLALLTGGQTTAKEYQKGYE